MKFGFVGASYTAKSNVLADEECINLYAETNETPGAQAQRSYLWTPGLDSFAMFPEGSVRGTQWTGTRAFAVAYDTLYEVFEDGSYVALGNVQNDGKAVSIAYSNIQLLVVSSGRAYCFTLTADPWQADTVYDVGDIILDPSGHIQEATAAAWKASTDYAIGAQIVDSNGNIQEAQQARWKETTAYLAGAEIVDVAGHIQKAVAAVWQAGVTYKLAAQIVDSNSNIQTAARRIWVANTAYALNTEIVDSNGNVQKVTTAGVSGASEPVWATSGTTADGTGALVWTYQADSDDNAGTSGSSEPSWSGSGNTPDGPGTLVWVYSGASSGSAGTSGDTEPTFDDAGGSVADGTGTLTWEDQGVTSIAGTSGTATPAFLSSGLTADANTLVWAYVAGSEGSAGQSGAAIPTFDDAGGTTPDGTGTLVWQDKGLRLLDVTDQLAGAPIKAKYSDGYFIVIFAESNKFQISDILDGTTWPGLYVNAVSVFAENIVSIEVSHRELWIFGSLHAQPYQDTGSDNVFDVIPGALVETGSAATFGTILLDNTIFWVNRDQNGAYQAWRASGYTPQRVSTHAVEIALASYGSIADLVSYSYQDGGHLFWMLYIPGADCTWCYDVSEGMWHKRAEWHQETATFGPHRSWNHIFAFGKHLFGDWNSPTLNEMSMNLYDDNGAEIRRVRRSPTISNELDFVYFSELRVMFNTGQGPQPPLVDGDGNPRPPQAMLRWSDDHGCTWSNQHIRDCGYAGEYGKMVRWQRLGQTRYGRVFELTLSDPVPWAILDAYLK